MLEHDALISVYEQFRYDHIDIPTCTTGVRSYDKVYHDKNRNEVSLFEIEVP